MFHALIQPVGFSFGLIEYFFEPLVSFFMLVLSSFAKDCLKDLAHVLGFCHAGIQLLIRLQSTAGLVRVPGQGPTNTEHFLDPCLHFWQIGGS